MKHAQHKQLRTLRLRDVFRQSLKRRQGMTLIEIMIVVTIMAALMGVVGWFVIGQGDKANIDIAETQVKKIKSQVEMYYSYYHKFPEEMSDLVDTPDGTKIIEEVPVDPWDQEYVLEKSGDSVKIYSPGPDGSPNSDDDIIAEVSK